ncbi:MAG: ABC transporter ATP-binding protein, partial [Chitinophagaceae bacterium]
MKKYARLIQYLQKQRLKIFQYFLFTVLSILFSLVSIGTLPFFLKLIFTGNEVVLEKPQHAFDIIKYFNYTIGTYVKTHGDAGKLMALGWISLLIITAVFLKNLFYYLSFYVLSPLKMSIVKELRQEVYQKL